MKVLRSFLEKQLGASLVLASLLGLVFPFGDILPRYTPVVLLALLIFFSCYRIKAPIQGELSRSAVLFCLGRYSVLPIVLWYICHLLAPDYALAVLLTALLPAGASSAAISGLYGGNVALGLVVTVLSSLASLILIPVFIPLIGHSDIAVDTFVLLRTLVFCVLVPVIFYRFLRKNTAIFSYNERYGRLTTAVIIYALSFFAFAKQRGQILQDPTSLFFPILIAIGCYLLFMLFGFIFGVSPKDRITYGVSSTFNNSSLGLSLAVLHFDTKIILFSITTLILWAFLPFFVQPVVNRISGKENS